MPEFELKHNPTKEKSSLLPLRRGEKNPKPAPMANPILEEQKTLGNQGMLRFAQACPLSLPSPSLCPTGGACHACPARIQTKLTISQPGDKYEQEADQVAEQVMDMPEQQVQRQPEEEEEELIQAKLLSDKITPLVQRQIEKDLVQRKLEPDYSMVTEDIEKRLGKTNSKDSPLPKNIQEYMGYRFGYDFNEVKVHNAWEASELCRSLNAQAFAIGKDVYFNSGKYDPNSTQGKKLIAHELTHVVQQRHGGIQPTIKRQKGPELPKQEPPKTTKDPAEIVGTVVKAFFMTEMGKKAEKKLKEAATSEQGIVLLSMLAVPTIATMFAEKMEMPQGVVGLIPKVAKIEIGKDMELAFQPIYKGRLGERPKEWGGMALFTIKRW